MKLKDFTDDLDMVEKMISKIIPILQKYTDINNDEIEKIKDIDKKEIFSFIDRLKNYNKELENERV